MQDLVLRGRVIRYRRERWVTSQGRTIVAALPPGVRGHWGPELRRFVLLQYHQGQVTVERLTVQLRAIGTRLLIDGQDDFLGENRDVLRAGLRAAAWITVDDTGARHARQNRFCTQIGNDSFTWFGTRASKSRLNFLDLLRAGHTDYVINDAALSYMRSRALARFRRVREASSMNSAFASFTLNITLLKYLGRWPCQSPLATSAASPARH